MSKSAVPYLLCLLLAAHCSAQDQWQIDAHITVERSKIPGTEIKVPTPPPTRPTYTHGIPIPYLTIAHSSSNVAQRKINSAWGILADGYNATVFLDRIDGYIAAGCEAIWINGPYGSTNISIGDPPEEPVPFIFDQYDRAAADLETFGELVDKAKWRAMVDHCEAAGCEVISQIDGYHGQGCPFNDQEYGGAVRPDLLRNCEHLMYSDARICWGAGAFYDPGNGIDNAKQLKFMKECRAQFRTVPIVEAPPDEDQADKFDYYEFDQAAAYSTFYARHVAGTGTLLGHHFDTVDDPDFPTNVNILIVWSNSAAGTNAATARSEWQALNAEVPPQIAAHLVPVVSYARIEELIAAGHDIDLDNAP